MERDGEVYHSAAENELRYAEVPDARRELPPQLGPSHPQISPAMYFSAPNSSLGLLDQPHALPTLPRGTESFPI